MFARVLSSSVSRHASRSVVKTAPRWIPAVSRPSRPLIMRFASSTSTPSFIDPTDAEAIKALEEGTQKLEEGDLEGATQCYERSVQIRRTAHTLYNLGVIRYHAKDYDAAIDAWLESIDMEPRSADAHTNLASAYIMSPLSRPELALKHLRIAHRLAPDDPEICFNLAAVLEAGGHLEEALSYYKQSKDRGIERAAVNIRNVGGKLLAKKLKGHEDAEDKQ
ncbi:TPR-like protein [Calocera viscosa TUFC12733]|uniref:TPR-like protein n=1 Tax=Calocera viscosa (strain TUFC12733) TaxID=1330018 RepID=A0A167SG38_CALVF|nr:TPR-like protein [Calocera viscosa TUFC12733]